MKNNMESAEQAKAWKIKMVSTFSFINMKPLKVSDKWRGDYWALISYIFEVRATKNDELMNILTIKVGKTNSWY